GAVRDMFNALLFYDLHLIEAILARALPHRDELLRSVAAMAELEALASLACFAWEQPVTCYPGLASDRTLAIESGRHPLIDPAHVVANDLHLAGNLRTWIITGSNMAGKSTFLRMAGLNTLFAQIGAACCANGFIGTPVRLMTDLRARDNLAREES